MSMHNPDRLMSGLVHLRPAHARERDARRRTGRPYTSRLESYGQEGDVCRLESESALGGRAWRHAIQARLQSPADPRRLP